MDREGKLLGRGRVANRVGGQSRGGEPREQGRKRERNRRGRPKVGARGVRATEEKQMSEGKGMAHGGGGARNVQRGGRRWSRLAGSLVDPAASSARRDVTMAVVVIAVRCDTVIS